MLRWSELTGFRAFDEINGQSYWQGRRVYVDPRGLNDRGGWVDQENGPMVTQDAEEAARLGWIALPHSGFSSGGLDELLSNPLTLAAGFLALGVAPALLAGAVAPASEVAGALAWDAAMGDLLGLSTAADVAAVEASIAGGAAGAAAGAAAWDAAMADHLGLSSAADVAAIEASLAAPLAFPGGDLIGKGLTAAKSAGAASLQALLARSPGPQPGPAQLAPAAFGDEGALMKLLLIVGAVALATRG